MRKLLAFVRLFTAALAMVITFIVVLLTGWMKAKIAGGSVAGWSVSLLTRLLNRIFNIRLTCTDPKKIRRHHGFLFPNHSTYLDILAMLSISPVRFLATADTRNRPLVGYFAASIGCVFVDRSDKSSRRQARQQVACSFRADPYPPIVLFPEGKLNPGTRLLPFFHGAFEIAAQHGITYLPCAIRYSHPEISTWGYGGVKEGMMQALWRLASFSGPLFVTVTPLEAVTPKADDDIARLALNTKYAIEETLGFEHGENQMPENVEFG